MVHYDVRIDVGAADDVRWNVLYAMMRHHLLGSGLPTRLLCRYVLTRGCEMLHLVEDMLVVRVYWASSWLG